MTINTLIEKGEEVKKTCYNDTKPVPTISGQEYENWKATCKRFLQMNYCGTAQAVEFEEIANNCKHSLQQYEKLMAILVALRDIPNK